MHTPTYLTDNADIIKSMFSTYYRDLGPKVVTQLTKAIDNPKNEFWATKMWPWLCFDTTGAFGGEKHEIRYYLPLHDPRKRIEEFHQINSIAIKQGFTLQTGQEHLDAFSNFLTHSRNEAPEHDEDLKHAPKDRVYAGGWIAFTIEYDYKVENDADATLAKKFLAEQFAWCRRDGKIEEVFDAFSVYLDFKGINVTYSGNKSVHIHVLFDPWDAIRYFKIDPHDVRPGFIAHWKKVADTVEGILDVKARWGVEADASLARPEQQRRLPFGVRPLKKPNLMGVPAGTNVPQVVLWEQLPKQASKNVKLVSFFNGSKFSKTVKTLARTQHVGGMGSDAEQYCFDKLDALTKGHAGEWPKLASLKHTNRGWIAHFYNDASDGNPASILKEGYDRILFEGSGKENLKKFSYPKTLGELLNIWRAEWNINNPTLEVEKFTQTGYITSDQDEMWFEETAISREAVREGTSKLMKRFIRGFPVLCAKGVEGGGKSTSVMMNHGVFIDWCKLVDERVSGMSMYAFSSYDHAIEKCADFNKHNAGNQYHGVVLPSFSRLYEEVCADLQVKMISRKDIWKGKYAQGRLAKIIEEAQPTVWAEMQDRHSDLWASIGGKTPVFFTQHQVMQQWTSTSQTRVFWHREFFGCNDTKRMRAEMRLALAVHDEIGPSDFYKAHRACKVEWVQKMIAGQSKTMQGNLYKHYKSWLGQKGQPKDAKGNEWGITFEEVMEIKEQNYDGSHRLTLDYSIEPYGGPQNSDEHIYTAVHGSEWYAKKPKWWDGLATRVVCLTTEILPSKIMASYSDVKLLTMNAPHLPRDVINVELRQGVNKTNLQKTIEQFNKDVDGEVVVVTNNYKEVDNAKSHLGVKGSNVYDASNIVQTMMWMSPEQYEHMLLINQLFSFYEASKLSHIDTFNQTAGRNSGMRKKDGTRHWLLMGRNMWLHMDYTLLQHTRYDIELMATGICRTLFKTVK